ncbi:MAG: hypothetical protein AAF569_03900 [Pseudomonadota bacterium]
MTSVPGASRFLNAATLANQQGLSPSTTSLLSNTATSATSLLDAGRINNNGIGLSASARAQTRQFLDATATGFNQIFSLNGVEFGTNESLQQKILALRASVPESKIAEDLRPIEVEADAETTEGVDIEV